MCVLLVLVDILNQINIINCKVNVPSVNVMLQAKSRKSRTHACITSVGRFQLTIVLDINVYIGFS